MSKFQYMTTPVPTTKMPRSILFIVVNECAERFSFYGMSAILVVFMTKYLKNSAGQLDVMSQDTADFWFHIFTMCVYFTPVVGALIADIFWGKYNTILYVSLLYCVGHATLALGDTRLFLAIGLTCLALGAGGIKPCVSANVGDQFGKHNENLLVKVYNWFYFAINVGAFLSQIGTPYLRAHFGPSVAFAVPGVLMAFATIVFFMGRKLYVHAPPQGWGKVKENFSGENLKILLRMLVFFLFVSPYYALYYQGSGAWVNQADHLNRHFLGFTLEQDQVQSINAILILVYIPIFAYVLYPLLGKVVKLTAMRKIGAGMFTMIPVFMVSAYIEKRIQAGETPNVGWQLLAYALLTFSEILVSIPALEFAYTQAPKKLKSLILSFYLAGSIGFGNAIAAAVIGYVFKLPSIMPHVQGPNYYYAFLGLMVVATVAYIVLSMMMPVKDIVLDDAPAA